MVKLLMSSLLISLCVVSSLGQDSVVEDTELLMTFMVHRHGDRTPMGTTITYGTDVEALEEATAKYGYGQLTDNGRRTAYNLGLFIRKRYDEILSPYYNKSEIHIRATDSTRTKMTVLTAMAAVYPTNEDNWSQTINWTPVPYTTLPAKYDSNLGVFNCPVLVTKQNSIMQTSSEELNVYSELLDEWSEISGYNMSSMSYLPMTLYDVYKAQISLGVPVPERVAELFPEMEKAAATAWKVIYGSDNALSTGVLLNQFFTIADQIVAGEDVPRVQVLAAHDANVFAFKIATGITSTINVVKFAAMYALELRKTTDGEYLVVPIYLADPNEGVMNYLQMDGCDGFCDLESFRDLTSADVLDEDTWRSECGWTEDYAVDTSSID